MIEELFKDYLHTTFLTKEEYAELMDHLDFIKMYREINIEEFIKKLPPVINQKDLEAPVVTIESLEKRQFSADQRTEEWLSQRNNYITASVSAACAGLMGPKTRLNQLLEKATYGKYRTFTGGYHTEKGNLFEPVTNGYYCYKTGKTIHEFNLIPHQVYEFIGASTDGVTDDLINIEIKTLVGRKMDPDKIKKEYYHQMQHQMACLGLLETDFIEAKYSEHESFIDTEKEQGIIVELFDRDPLYSPFGEDAIAWLEKIKAGGVTPKKITFWVLEEYQCRRVKMDPKWIHEMVPKLKTFWDEVNDLRSNPDKLDELLSEQEEKCVC